MVVKGIIVYFYHYTTVRIEMELFFLSLSLRNIFMQMQYMLNADGTFSSGKMDNA